LNIWFRVNEGKLEQREGKNLTDCSREWGGNSTVALAAFVAMEISRESIRN